jgi:hypothetical protein
MRTIARTRQRSRNALGKGSNPSDFARIYYLGLNDRTSPPEGTTWKCYSCIGTDLISIIALVIMIIDISGLHTAAIRREALLRPESVGLSIAPGCIDRPLPHDRGKFLPTSRHGNLWLTFTSLALTLVAVLRTTLPRTYGNDTTDGRGI